MQTSWTIASNSNSSNSSILSSSKIMAVSAPGVWPPPRWAVGRPKVVERSSSVSLRSASPSKAIRVSSSRMAVNRRPWALLAPVAKLRLRATTPRKTSSIVSAWVSFVYVKAGTRLKSDNFEHIRTLGKCDRSPFLWFISLQHLPRSLCTCV